MIYPEQDASPAAFSGKAFLKYFLAAIIGLLLGLTVVFHDQLSYLLAEVFQVQWFNKYPKLTYFALYLAAPIAAVYANNYFGYLYDLSYDSILKVSIMAEVSYLSPALAAIFISVFKEKDSLAATFAMMGIGLIFCFISAALLTVLLEKMLNKKTRT